MRHPCWQSRKLYWKGVPRLRVGGMGNQENASAVWLTAWQFMVMELPSRLLLGSPLSCARIGSDLMRRTDSEKPLMLGKTESKRRRGQQRVRWLDGVTDLMDMSLSSFWELPRDREAWYAVVHGVSKSQTPTVQFSNWTELNLVWLRSLLVVNVRLSAKMVSSARLSWEVGRTYYGLASPPSLGPSWTLLVFGGSNMFLTETSFVRWLMWAVMIVPDQGEIAHVSCYDRAWPRWMAPVCGSLEPNWPGARELPSLAYCDHPLPAKIQKRPPEGQSAVIIAREATVRMAESRFWWGELSSGRRGNDSGKV